MQDLSLIGYEMGLNSSSSTILIYVFIGLVLDVLGIFYITKAKDNK